MKNLEIATMEQLEGGICLIGPGNNQNCLPCPAFLVIFEGNPGGFGGPIICPA